MPESPVYGSTTEKDKTKAKSCCVWTAHLKILRCVVKILEVVLSAIAFICEELVEHCVNCSGLYFFEFMSCTAMLLSLVVVVVYCTTLSEKITLDRLKLLDIWFTLIVGLLFLLASIVFSATQDGSVLEKVSVAFGFLATVVFLIDFGLLLKRENVALCSKKGEDATKNHQVPLSEVEQPLKAGDSDPV